VAKPQAGHVLGHAAIDLDNSVGWKVVNIGQVDERKQCQFWQCWQVLRHTVVAEPLSGSRILRRNSYATGGPHRGDKNLMNPRRELIQSHALGNEPILGRLWHLHLFWSVGFAGTARKTLGLRPRCSLHSVTADSPTDSWAGRDTRSIASRWLKAHNDWKRENAICTRKKMIVNGGMDDRWPP